MSEAYSQRPQVERVSQSATEVEFRARLSAEEPFFTDHVIGGRRLMPGVVCLELVRAALEELPRFAHMGRLLFERVIWLNPVAVQEGPVTLNISLRNPAGKLSLFEVKSAERSIVHCRGRVYELADLGDRQLHTDVCLARPSHELSGDQCYAVFEAAGACYGRTHRGLQSVAVYGSGLRSRVAVSRIEWHEPDAYAPDYMFHPGRLDSAMQSTIALLAMDAAGRPLRGPPALPFAVDELEVFERCPARARAHIREVASASPVSRKVDLEVSDENDRVCARMKGLSVLAPRVAREEKQI